MSSFNVEEPHCSCMFNIDLTKSIDKAANVIDKMKSSVNGQVEYTINTYLVTTLAFLNEIYAFIFSVRPVLYNKKCKACIRSICKIK